MGKMGTIAAIRDEAYGELIGEGYPSQEAMLAADRIAWREWEARLATVRRTATAAPQMNQWGRGKRTR
jgi:hypothetical protein